MPATNGEIAPFDRMVGKLPCKAFMCGVGFRHDEEARRILVDPVNDAGAGYAANSR